jgi:hypothetical protein
MFPLVRFAAVIMAIPRALHNAAARLGRVALADSPQGD